MLRTRQTRTGRAEDGHDEDSMVTIAPLQSEGSSDEEIAALIRQAADGLNEMISLAAKRGLDVEITAQDISAMGEYPRSRSIYTVRVTRKTVL